MTMMMVMMVIAEMMMKPTCKEKPQEPAPKILQPIHTEGFFIRPGAMRQKEREREREREVVDVKNMNTRHEINTPPRHHPEGAPPINTTMLT